MTKELGQCGGFEVAPIAATCPERNFKSKGYLGLMMPASVPLIPKFASEGAVTVCELRNRDISYV
jgi:hypothetical protein